MSYVTDLVFIAPTREAAEIFQDAVEAHKDYRPQPIDSGDHCTSCHVFHLGVDYMPGELREWLLDGPASWGWPVGAVMYLYGEDDADPTIIVAERNGRPVTAEFVGVAAAQVLYCVACLIEQHQGQRDQPNPATCTVNGMTSCGEHLVFGQQAGIPGRTPNGIILGGG